MDFWGPPWGKVPPNHVKVFVSKISTDIKKRWHLKLSRSKNWFLGGLFCSPMEGGTPKPRRNIFLLNIDWYQKIQASYVKQFKKLMFVVGTWGGPR